MSCRGIIPGMVSPRGLVCSAGSELWRAPPIGPKIGSQTAAPSPVGALTLDPFQDPDPDPDPDLGFQLRQNRTSAPKVFSSSQFGPPIFHVEWFDVSKLGKVDDDPGDDHSSPDSMKP